MSRKGGFFDNPFGGFFDFNGDGKESLAEQFIAHQLLDSDTGTRSYRTSDTDWRDSCEDGSDYDVDPEDYETEEEYEEDLNAAKYAWRDTCEDGFEYDVDPEDYETEEEYEEALDTAKYGWRDTCEDGMDFCIFPEDYETAEEYEEALNAAKYGWRDSCEDDSEYGIDPEDYETEEEYEEALNTAKYGWRDTCEDGSDYDVDPEDYETEEEYADALQQARLDAQEAADQEPDDPDGDTDDSAAPEEPETPDEEADAPPAEPAPPCGEPQRKAYPNARKYKAAVMLHDLKNGDRFYSDKKRKRLDRKRCEFILNSPDIVAANYLTADGEFLFTQAVKEHFKLPFAVEEEDEEPEVLLAELLEDLANVDALLALEVWEWCADTFYPYRHFAASDDTIATSVLQQLSTLPDLFVDTLIDHIAKDRKWAEILLCGGRWYKRSYADLLSRFLERGSSEIPKQMLERYIAQAGIKPKEVGELFDFIIDASKTDDDLVAMELVKADLLPVIEKIPLLERKLPHYRKEIDGHIQYIETYEDKYAWSRRYAWRAAWRDAPLFGLDPLAYETEVEYLQAAEKEKYRWRTWHERDEKVYGILTAAYETEAAYNEAVAGERQRRREAEEQQRAEQRRQRAEELRQRKVQKAADPLAGTDQTVYTFYGVQFPNGPGIYYYRSDDSTLEIGDRVIVQTGANQREIEVEIVTVQKHRRATAPYPVDETRFILRRAEDAAEE